MTSTQASKRMRFAALGLSTALSVGTLAPFIGFSSASAATSCTTVSSGYSKASASLAVHEAKLHKAKKKLKKAKRHHASHRVIKHDKKKVHKLRRKIRHDKANRTYWSNQRTHCTTGSAANPTGSANPLTDILGALTGTGLSPAALTDALNSVISQLKDSGAPGAAQLADALQQVSDAIAKGATSIDPSQLQKILSQLPSQLDPTAFQKALTDAANAIQKALATPPTTANGLIDAILTPLIAGLSDFSAASPLTDALKSLQTQLDAALTQLGLPGLGGLSQLPGSGGLPITIPGLG